jgi:ATP-dependent DNA helicase RecQ
VLQGRDDDRVRQRGHDALSVFGILSHEEAPLLRPAMRAAMAHEMLTTTEHGGLALGTGARAVLKGEQVVTIAEPRKKTRRSRRDSGTNPTGDPLFEALRAKRAELARANGIPAYIIFHDSVLREIASAKPHSLEAMATLPGIGAKKLDTYGEDFCEGVRASL